MGERRKEVRRVEKGEGEGRQEESGGEVGWGIRERGEQRWMDGVQEVMRRMRGKGASSEADS